MNSALLVSALLMGVAGTPHCLAMCGPACAAIGGGGRGAWPFHLGRALSYAVAGSIAAAGVGALASLGQAFATLRPLWTLVHVAALVLGLYLLWQGRQPAWMANLGSTRTAAAAGTDERWPVVSGPGAAYGPGRASQQSGKPGSAQRPLAWAPARRAAIGLAWVAWPCGLLQSALLVAALADRPWQGALVMLVFAAASGVGLAIGPVLWWRLGKASTGTWAVRLAGLMLVAACAWSLGHGMWMQVAAWCGIH